MSTQSFMNTRDVYVELTIFAKRLQFQRLKNYRYSTAVHVYVRLTSTEFNIVAPLDLGRFAQ